MPAEWAQHEAVWIGFPSHLDAWEEADLLSAAQIQIAAFANAVQDGGRGETVHLIAGSADAAARARDLVETGVVVAQKQIGDVWLRDTACIIVSDGSDRRARNFGFIGAAFGAWIGSAGTNMRTHSGVGSRCAQYCLADSASTCVRRWRA